jgi:hypothetical protein
MAPHGHGKRSIVCIICAFCILRRHYLVRLRKSTLACSIKCFHTVENRKPHFKLSTKNCKQNLGCTSWNNDVSHDLCKEKIIFGATKWFFTRFSSLPSVCDTTYY